MSKQSKLTVDRLKTLLSYDKETGFFTRNVKVNRNTVVGSIAGSPDRNGHLIINVDGIAYMAHRLAWFYVNGKWPTNVIDHINGIKDDNRIVNLRDVTIRENSQNRRKSPSHSVSGLLGACFIKSSGKYRSRITIDGKIKHLGHFDSAEEAHAVYVKEKREVHKTCSI